MPKSDSARKPKPKLPKVWVLIDLGTEPRFYSSGYFFTSKKEAEEWCTEGGETVHPYIPLQPPRRCVWRKVLRFWESCEGTETDIGKFCPRCGGRIVRRMA